jgi:hypothetical protein
MSAQELLTLLFNVIALLFITIAGVGKLADEFHISIPSNARQ